MAITISNLTSKVGPCTLAVSTTNITATAPATCNIKSARLLTADGKEVNASVANNVATFALQGALSAASYSGILGVSFVDSTAGVNGPVSVATAPGTPDWGNKWAKSGTVVGAYTGVSAWDTQHSGAVTFTVSGS